MQRREFITLLAGAALIGPPTAIAQTPKVYRLGTLTAGPPMSPGSGDAAVLIGALTQRGYTLGQNLTYEARGAGGKLSQMPQQMQELKTANVDVVVTVSYPAALIAKSSGIPTAFRALFRFPTRTVRKPQAVIALATIELSRLVRSRKMTTAIVGECPLWPPRPDPCTAAKQHDRLINPSTWRSAAFDAADHDPVGENVKVILAHSPDTRPTDARLRVRAIEAS